MGGDSCLWGLEVVTPGAAGWVPWPLAESNGRNGEVASGPYGKIACFAVEPKKTHQSRVLSTQRRWSPCIALYIALAYQGRAFLRAGAADSRAFEVCLSSQIG